MKTLTPLEQAKKDWADEQEFDRIMKASYIVPSAEPQPEPVPPKPVEIDRITENLSVIRIVELNGKRTVEIKQPRASDDEFQPASSWTLREIASNSRFAASFIQSKDTRTKKER